MEYTTAEKKIINKIKKSSLYEEYPISDEDIDYILAIRRKALSLMEKGILEEDRQKAIKILAGLFQKISRYLEGASKQDVTLDAIGIWMGVTRERIRQLESTAIRKLKHPKVGRAMKEYLELGGAS